jgi:tetratricopeptide (TPR) repeat protein
MAANDRSQAASLWASAVREAGTAERGAATIENVLGRLREVYEPAVLVSVMEQMEPHLGLAACRRRALLVKIASMQYDDAQYKECLETLERADALVSRPEESQDMNAGFLRALSLARLQQFKEAAAVLERMADYVGTDEQHARALFLIGWVHLQLNAPREAIATYDSLMRKYPKTSFVAKASELVNRLRSDESQP